MNLINSETIPIFWAGGSQIKITADGIFITTNGKFEVKAAKHDFTDGMQIPMNIPVINPLHSGYFIVRDKESGEIVENYPYTVTLKNGRVITGNTNSQGETLLVSTVQPEEMEFKNNQHNKSKDHQLNIMGGGTIKLKFEFFDE